MAQQVVNLEKLADAAMEAATLAAEKVAEVRSGDDLTAQQIVNLEKPAKAQEVDGGGTVDGYRVILRSQQPWSGRRVVS
jgi:hypothetical protein